MQGNGGLASRMRACHLRKSRTCRGRNRVSYNAWRAQWRTMPHTTLRRTSVWTHDASPSEAGICNAQTMRCIISGGSVGIPEARRRSACRIPEGEDGQAQQLSSAAERAQTSTIVYIRMSEEPFILARTMCISPHSSADITAPRDGAASESQERLC